MTHILHVVEALSSGILTSISTICRVLASDFDHTVLHGARAETPADPSTVFPNSTRFVPWDVGRAISPWRDWAAFRALRDTVREVRPDIVHAHSSKAGALARLAFPGGGIPIVYSPRGYSFLRQDAGRVGRATCRAIEKGLGLLPHVTVACGLGEYEQALRVSRRAILIPNMLDPRLLPRRRHGSAAGAPLRAAMVGGIRAQKNFPLFCAIAERFRADEMDFMWIGGGAEGATAAAPPNVTVTGWLPRDDALARLAQADVLLQTALWEGLSIAMLEAMAMGLAVLALPAFGKQELVVEGLNGYMCTDADAFAARLRELIAAPSRLESFGAASRDIVHRRHDAMVVADQWRSLYRHHGRYFRYG